MRCGAVTTVQPDFLYTARSESIEEASVEHARMKLSVIGRI
jgi:hypothetical protein